jgi:hypothetical protein
VTEKQNFLHKMAVKTLSVPQYIDDIFPLEDIQNSKDKSYSTYNLSSGRKVVVFKREDMIDTNSLSDKEYLLYGDDITKIINKFKDGQRFTLQIKIDNVSSAYKKLMLEENSDELSFFKEFKKHKYEQTKDYKHISVYGAVEESDYLKKTSLHLLLSKLKLKPMTAIETFNYLYDHFNLDRRTNSLSAKDLPKNIVKRLGAADTSLLRLLYNSYIEVLPNCIGVGDSYLKVYEVSMPSHNMNVNRLMDDLSLLKSNATITINFTKNSNIIYKMQNKKRGGSGSLISTINSLNGLIVDNLKKLEEYLNKSHNTMCECNITIVLYNNNYDELIADNINFDSFDGAQIIYNRYRPIESYFETIAGFSYLYKNAIYLTTKHQASLITPTSYDKDMTPSIFTDSRNFINSYNFHSKKKLVNSGLISAPAGRGKSVLLNYIYNQYHIMFTNNLHSFILDYGGSYKPLVDRLNRDLAQENQIVYKKLVVGSKEYINIFDLEFGKEISKEYVSQKISLLLYFFKIAFKGTLSEEELILLDILLQKVYSSILFDDDFKKVTENDSYDHRDFWIDKYNKSNYTDTEAFINSMPLFSDLPMILASTDSIRNSFDPSVIDSLNNQLSNFTKTSHSQVFTQKSSSIVSNRHIIIDIKDVIGADKSGYLATLYFVYYAQSRYMSFIDKSIKDDRKLMVVDEYPRLLKVTPDIEDFIDMLLKTGRKEKIDTYIIGQNISTFNEDFFENIGNCVIFKPNTRKEIEKIKDYVGVDDEFISLVDDISSVPGQYSEMMVISFSGDEIEKTKLRLALNKFDIQYMTI